jgi:subtilase family serine protease
LGYGPSDLQSAYSLTSATSGSGQKVAIVDAFDDPNAFTDVNVYRSSYRVAQLVDCSTGQHPCFSKVVQYVNGLPPGVSGSWAQEISLDLDMVSAACPRCDILLVEAYNNSVDSLSATEDYAAANANEVSNSWGAGDGCCQAYDSHFDHPGKAITFSTGDNGWGVEWPASVPTVTAVGGTHLTRDSNARGWNETVWGTPTGGTGSGTGSGCSAVETKPSWQVSNANITGVCGKRAVAEVSADADPATGVAVYDSLAYQGLSGWLVFGGTSVASPLIASVYALGGDAASVPYAASIPYSRPSSAFNDVISGTNGSCGNILCNAGPAWDGPTGLGTPNGVGGF